MKFYNRPEPNVGDTRSRVRFALFPKRIQAEEEKWVTVWLEDYLVREEYKEYGKRIGVLLPTYAIVRGWVVIEEHLMEVHYS